MVQRSAAVRDLQRRIVAALHRHADIDAHQVTVVVEDDKVVLDGTVSSWPERDAAEQAVGAAPGIREVGNRIVVVPRGSLEAAGDIG